MTARHLILTLVGVVFGALPARAEVVFEPTPSHCAPLYAAFVSTFPPGSPGQAAMRSRYVEMLNAYNRSKGLPDTDEARHQTNEVMQMTTAALVARFQKGEISREELIEQLIQCDEENGFEPVFQKQVAN